MSPVAKSRTSAPASDAPAPAGDAERGLLEALAQRYGADPFSARSAASDLAPALWLGVGISRPDPAACGRWLRAHKGPVHGFVLTGKVDRNGADRWRLRGIEVRKAETANAETQAEPIPPAPTLPPPSEIVSPEPLPAPLARPWWSVAPAPLPAAGGAAERPRGAWWWSPDEVAP